MGIQAGGSKLQKAQDRGAHYPVRYSSYALLAQFIISIRNVTGLNIGGTQVRVIQFARYVMFYE